MDLPVEIWFDILKYVNIIELSKLNCVNVYFYNLIRKNKWTFIDNLIDKNFNYIPKTKRTLDNFKYCIDWTSIILNNRDIEIPNSVIEWIDDRQDLEYLCIYQVFTERTIRKLFEKIHWNLLLKHQFLPLDLLTFIIETYDLSGPDWSYVWGNPCITVEFITRYIDFAQWHVISRNKEILSIELIERYGNRLFLHEITKLGINESVITYYLKKMDRICWLNVSQFTKLSLPFIKKHIDKLNLHFILNYQEIDESYLTTIIDKIQESEYAMCFQSISLNQKISYDFMLKYKKDLHLKFIISNKKILKNDIFRVYEQN